MIGYKAFNEDWTCRNKQYEIGKTYIENVEPQICISGMHFCLRLQDVFNFYPISSNTKVALVEATGKVVFSDDGIKACTNHMHIIREITPEELKIQLNFFRNIEGFFNTGIDNRGIGNSGKFNTGICNTGNSNIGDYNTGNSNTGDYNTGDFNTGHFNAGNGNTGDFNTGQFNIGNCNAGNDNIGDYNVGDYNNGNYNIGDFNNCDCAIGCFMTESQETFISFFNKPSTVTLKEWNDSKIKHFLDTLVPCNPNERQDWYISLSEEKKRLIKSIPNFDADIFYQCTGIKVDP